MRLLSLVIAFVLSVGLGAYALAENKTTCVEFNGIQYCETTTVIKIGEKEIPVDDPFALLNSAKSSKAEKIALWDVYKYPDVITELARQVMMTEDELIYYLRDADPAWMALYELTQIYDEAANNLKGKNVDALTIDKLFNNILADITMNIRDQLKDYDGVAI